MVRMGYSVLRVPSSLVLRQRIVVCDAILAALEGRITESVDTLDMKFTRPSPGAKRQVRDVSPRHKFRKPAFMRGTQFRQCHHGAAEVYFI